ncbi:MAG: O-methyltransferase [Bacteroidales bacterium]|jgi:predicted O-methyltransferase YrrM
MFLFRLNKFLTYKMFSRHKRGHGIHSPFLYDLIRSVFRNKTEAHVVLMVERIRKRNRNDKSRIKIEDLGSGSLSMGSKTRRVSDISKYSSVPKKYGILLSNLAMAFGKETILELGTSLGISTLYLALGSRESTVHTIEGCEAVGEIAGRNFLDAGVENIVQHFGSFDDLLPEIIKSGINPSLVFIDGNHRREAVLRYVGLLADHVDEDTVIVLDDIYLSPGMALAWEEIKRRADVTLTVDIHRMGLIFFRKSLNKLDTVVRY